ncbi:MAG: thymidine phosphorylase, partial [Jatrophihabitantaceae bacterium]
ARRQDRVSAGAGVVMFAKPGDVVHAGQPLLELHADEVGRFERAIAALDGAYDIGNSASVVRKTPLIIDRIG